MENIAADILMAITIAIAFFAGYCWRAHVERRLHNMPWLKKSARRFAAKGPQTLRVIKPSEMEVAGLPDEENLPLQKDFSSETVIASPPDPAYLVPRKALSLRRISK